MSVCFTCNGRSGGYLDLFFFLSVIVCSSIIAPSQQQLYGQQNLRFKRNPIRMSRHGSRGYNDFRPQANQEDQVIIDESSIKDINHAGVKASSRGRPGCENKTNPLRTATLSSSSPGSVKIIETAVFLDQALDNRFNGLSNGLVELNKLVLTIMNQVQRLFRYSSMRVPIKISLVLIEHIKDSEKFTGIATPSPEGGDIDAYLSNFCNWQQTRLDQDKRLWWDHAILLSGLVDLGSDKLSIGDVKRDRLLISCFAI